MVEECSNILLHLQKVFNDPVLGHIELHPLCVLIVDTPEFQRLRNIKQIGGTYFVYPGAAHNRFEHSIGTCYLAKVLLQELRHNSSVPMMKLNATSCVRIGYNYKDEFELVKMKTEIFTTRADLFLAKIELYFDARQSRTNKEKRNEEEEYFQEAKKKLDEAKKTLDQAYKNLNEAKVKLSSIKEEEFTDIMKTVKTIVEKFTLSAEDFTIKAADFMKDKNPEVKKELIANNELLKASAALNTELFTQREELCVQIAALCHDLGRGPFSHLFESRFMSHFDKNWTYEKASVQMFEHMWKSREDLLKAEFENYSLGDEETLIFIKELISGFTTLREKYQTIEEGQKVTNPVYARYERKINEGKKTFLFEIVNNLKCKMDVDKWDSYARDCFQLGIPNNFDHLRYIKFCCVLYHEESDQKVLCAREKEIENIYSMFNTRNKLYRMAYQHKTSVIIERMITEAFLLANKYLTFRGKNSVNYPLAQSVTDMEAYLKVTDDIFYQIANFTPSVKDDYDEKDEAMIKAQELLMRVQNRKLYRYLGQYNVSKNFLAEDDEEKIRTNLEDASKHVSPTEKTFLKKDWFVVDIADLHYGTKEHNPIDKMFFYNKKNPTRPIPVDKQQISQLLPEKFREQRILIYFKGEKGEVNDPDLKLAYDTFEQWKLKCNHDKKVIWETNKETVWPEVTKKKT